MESAAPIFVAGKSGQLGRCLSDIARRRNIRIAVAGRPDFDIEQSESIDRVLNAVTPQIIINAAAYTAVDKAETEPERCYLVNRDGAGQLAAAAWRRKVPFIHISTDYVFDGRKPSPYREDDGTTPLGVYGDSKLEGELAVLAAHPEALILRTSWVYSPFGSNFVKTVLQLAESRPLLRVVDDQRGCPTSAHDLAAALLDIVPPTFRNGRRTPGGRNLSFERQRTDDLVRVCGRNISKRQNARLARSRAGGDYDGGLSDSRAKARQQRARLHKDGTRVWNQTADLVDFGGGLHQSTHDA